jgi:hypothetical protein
MYSNGRPYYRSLFMQIFSASLPSLAQFDILKTVILTCHWHRRFESCSGHGCVSACFCVVLSCVSVEALCWTDPPTKESYQMSVDREIH